MQTSPAPRARRRGVASPPQGAPPSAAAAAPLAPALPRRSSVDAPAAASVYAFRRGCCRWRVVVGIATPPGTSSASEHPRFIAAGALALPPAPVPAGNGCGSGHGRRPYPSSPLFSIVGRGWPPPTRELRPLPSPLLVAGRPRPLLPAGHVCLVPRPPPGGHPLYPWRSVPAVARARPFAARPSCFLAAPPLPQLPAHPPAPQCRRWSFPAPLAPQLWPLGMCRRQRRPPQRAVRSLPLGLGVPTRRQQRPPSPRRLR